MLLNLFWSFFKIGFFTFGGGLAMIPFIQDEFINKKKWLTAEEMNEMIALSQSFPGVIAVNISIIAGHKLAGLKGAVAAAIGTVLPALLSIVLILSCLAGFQDNRYVQYVFLGIKAASAALIFDTVIRLARKNIKSSFAWTLSLVSLLLVLFNFSAAWCILMGAVAGIVAKCFIHTKGKKSKC